MNGLIAKRGERGERHGESERSMREANQKEELGDSFGLWGLKE